MNTYDFKKLKDLAYQASIRTYDLLVPLSKTIGLRPRNAFRPNDNKGLSGYHALFPNYQGSIAYNQFNKVWDSDETSTFLSYLESAPALPDDLSLKESDAIMRQRFRAGYLIQTPLLDALDETAFNQFLEGNDEPEFWALDKDLLRNKINNVVDELVVDPIKKKIYFKAICPIAGIESLQVSDIKLTENIHIRKHSLRERALLMTRYNNAFLLFDEFGRDPTLNEWLIEIELCVDAGQRPYDLIANYLDVIKWALVISCDMVSPPAEGVCLVLTKTGSRLKSLRRGDYSGYRKATFNNENLKKFLKLFGDLNTCMSRVKGLDKALWHFGRSCTSPIERDILLEAAIGIDAMVSRGGGDSRYKFCLHGAALLKSHPAYNSETDIFDQLTKIYNVRSSAAHGSAATTPLEDEITSKARTYLARMIESVLILNESNKLDLTNHGCVADAVHKFVLDKVTTHN